VAEVRLLREQIERLIETLATRDARIAELEKLLEDSRRSGKRQAAPFSKGDPAEEPARPGRRSGKNHGRHGHRAAPVGPVDRELVAPLLSCCPDCGGAIATHRRRSACQSISWRPLAARSTSAYTGPSRSIAIWGEYVHRIVSGVFQLAHDWNSPPAGSWTTRLGDREQPGVVRSGT
jgi:hypothetical protein